MGGGACVCIGWKYGLETALDMSGGMAYPELELWYGGGYPV